MAYNQLPAHFRDDFETTWEARIARRETDFYNFVKKVTISGEKKRYNQSEILDMRKKTGRAQKTQVDERDTYFRWLQPATFELTERVDEWDDKELGDILLPTSDMMNQHVDAYNRQVDRTIIEAVEGDAIVGEDGTSTQALTQVIADDYGNSGTAEGLTLKKLARLIKYFKDNDLKRGQKVFAVSPDAEEDLILAVNEAKSSDYSNAQIAESGTVDGQDWLGFKWVCHTGLSEDEGTNQGGDIVRCLAWHVDHIRFGDGERRAYTDVLPDYSHALQIRTTARMGAYRNEEKPVVAVEVDIA